MDYSQKLRQINNRYNPDSSVLVEQGCSVESLHMIKMWQGM